MSQAGFEQINKLTRENKPFLCVIDYQKSDPLVFTIDDIDTNLVQFEINGVGRYSDYEPKQKLEQWIKRPISKKDYSRSFKLVQDHLSYGDSFLLNLTFPTKIQTNLNLADIFHMSQARYKIWLKDQFVSFSPEPFIRIKDQIISSYPMKGTIRTSEPDASNTILRDPKEAEEHLTIVDLIRNDLAMVANDIEVERYRYIENIQTAQADLLQVSSKVVGKISSEYWPNLGDLLARVLPAGSISGAPKTKTLEIIQQAEQYERGYFTGIVGYFDGTAFDSGVMIRFVEQSDHGLIFKSGGGITVNSDCDKEYQEMIDKVYVPIV